MKFDDILEKLENNNEILNFKFETTQIPLYLTIRFMLIQSLINKEFNLVIPNSRLNKKSIIEIFKYIYYTLKLNIFFAPHKDIYIFSSGIVNKLEDGKYVNRLYDDFYNLFKNQTIIIESSVKLSYLLPKAENIYFRDLIDILIVLYSRIVKVKNQDLTEIESFMQYLQNNVLFKDNDDLLKKIESHLIKLSRKIGFSYWIYKKLIKIKKPKMIIIEDAHYFSHISLTKAAKSLGIKTVEYQHGYVGLAHPAYNYNKNIFENIKEYLPEYFLTHGEHWKNTVRTPSNKVSIGLAELSKKISKSAIGNEKEKKILFISGGTVFEELNELIAKSLNSLAKLGYEVLLRPHPSEVSAVDNRYASLIKQGVQIDTNNLYVTLPTVEIVAGMEVSTVLYEAICFTNKVYLMNTKYTKFYEPDSCFIPFVNADNLILSIKDGKTLTNDANDFWSKNWQENYKNFIENTIGIEK